MLERLRKRLAEIGQSLDTIRSTAEGAKRDLTPEEIAEIDKLTSEAERLGAQVDALERAEATSAALTERTGRRTASAAGVEVEDRGTGTGTLTAEQRTRETVRVGAERLRSDPRRGFRNMAEVAMSVRNACIAGGRIDNRLQLLQAEAREDRQRWATEVAGGTTGINSSTTYLNEGSASDYGFMVPPEMRAGIWELTFDGSDILGMINIEPTNSNAVEMEADETTPWGASSVTAKWRTEGSTMTAQKPPPTDPRMTRLNELYCFIKATNELLEDAPRLESRLTDKASQAIRWTASEAIINGTGVGQPLGWFKSPALITVSAEGGQSSATIVRQNLIKMFIRMLRLGGNSADFRWLLNPDILPALMELSLGNNGLFMLPNVGIAAAPQGSILGIPIEYNDHCKTLGTKGDIQLINPTGYYAIGKGGVKADSSIHLYFDQGLTAFRWTFRFGGQPFLSTPLTPANGTSTRSHFVTLADR